MPRKQIADARRVAVQAMLMISVTLACPITAYGGTGQPGDDPVYILPLGDSITQADTSHDSYRRSLWMMLQDWGCAEVDFVGSTTEHWVGGPPPNPDFDQDHEGHWGWRTDQILAELPTWLAGYTPDVALIHLGSNDMFQSRQVELAIDDLQAIISALRADNPNVRILLSLVIPTTDMDINLRIQSLNVAMYDIPAEMSTGQSPIMIVDMPSVIDPAVDTYDGVHPNEQGEQKMAQEWFDQLAPLLSFDDDDDGTCDRLDNCPGISNPSQADADTDGVGDACESSTGGPQTDEFNDANLDVGLWTFVDPAPDATQTMTGTQVSIEVPGPAAHEMWDNGPNAPRIVQDINDTDFEVEAKFDSIPAAQFQEIGLTVIQDATRYLRFEFFSDGVAVKVFAGSVAGGVGSFKTGFPTVDTATATSIWMRVKRVGDDWTLSYSTDGANFTDFAPFNSVLEVAQVGIYSGNNVPTGGGDAPAFTGLTDYFKTLDAGADSDGDGVLDGADNCPDEPNPGQENSDGDSHGDACDNCPNDDNEDQADNDGDAEGDVCDPDDDDDGILDDGDASGTEGDNPCTGGATANCDDNCPFDANPNQEDGDNNGIGDVCDVINDSDGDGVEDGADNCPDDANPGQENSDGDSLGDACDNCPNDDNEDQANADGDDLGDVCDDCPNDAENDMDADGVCGDVDNCPADANEDQIDTNGDGEGDVCDDDDDGDSVLDDVDNCPLVDNAGQENSDGDSLGDVCDDCPIDPDNDSDGDGVCGDMDNCPADANAGQENSDGDSLGDVCDNCPTEDNEDQANSDGDTLGDACDNCPHDDNEDQANADGDELGNVCDDCPDDADNDADGDGVCGDVDNCPDDPNAGQEDSDGDSLGDACDDCPDDADNDIDGDGICGDVDNCPDDANPDQADLDGDGTGDACDPETVLHVDDDAPNDPAPGDPTISDPLEDGSEDHPFDTIQEAIDRAYDGHEVLVHDGMYTGDGNRDVQVTGKSLTVRTENGPQQTIVDCEGLARGFRFVAPATDGSLLQGFTILDAYTSELQGGAGILCESASPTIRNCVIRNAWADGFLPGSGSGGGLAGIAASPIVEDCTFEGNWAYGTGGGMFVSGGEPVVDGCRFLGNIADLGGGGIDCAADTLPILRDTEFIGNQTWFTSDGGAVRSAASSLTMINCVAADNYAERNGGAVACLDAALLANCLLVNNMAVGSGGGIYNACGNMEVVNCTLQGNAAQDYGGAIYSDGICHPRILNSILRANTATDGHEIAIDSPEHTSHVVVEYSNVQGGLADVFLIGHTIIWGDGNIDLEAGFRDADGQDDEPTTWNDNDYRLAPTSPCIDAGDNTAVPSDLADLDDDDDIFEPLPFDRAGQPRRVDVPEIADTGSGDPPVVDMGAYEYFPDCNGNEIADVLEPDSDNDTIIDDCDLCPGFDDRLDEDSDGIADGCDDCPATIPGVQVDAFGCPPAVPADLDRDGDVDDDDEAMFEACASGPAVPFGAGCEQADLDDDEDADQGDFGLMQRCYSGENNPGDSTCAD